VIAYLTVLVVGVGSMLFHSTLLYEMQLMDEVPMVYGACVIGYCLTQIHGPMGKPNWRVCAVFALYSLVFTVVYLTLKWPIIHEVRSTTF
jgi:dihydroceramidase